jgi:3'(2'), 5'-bisphosphate nucleotidase
MISVGMRLESETERAKELAIRVGEILLDHYKKSSTAMWKGSDNPVTAADRAASDFITSELHRLFPNDAILCEEEPDDLCRLAASRVWIIDSMDGTREFLARLNEFAVMIGLAIEGIPCVGVVYQPTTSKLYYAATGTGAFLEERAQPLSKRRLRVSPESNPSRMTVALSRSHHSPLVDRIYRRLRVQDVLVAGGLGLKIGLICERRAHLCLYPAANTNQWDTCAPDAILREAGGIMTDLNNEALGYNHSELRNLQGVVASNGEIHDRIVEVTRSVLERESKTGS